MSGDNSKVFWECGNGWRALIEPIIQHADEIGATITQIKEKYGFLRVYFDPGHVDCDTLEDMVDKAEMDSATRCEMCGANAHLMVKGGWYKVLCKEHAIELSYKDKAA